MKKILIATDFSRHSKHTLQYVLNFFQDIQVPCHITLLNTYMVLPTDARQVIIMNDELKKKSLAGLHLEENEARQMIKNPHLKIEVISHMGSLKNVISNLFQAKKFDLVAMGKDGGKNVETVQTLLKQVECPLLVTYLAE